MTRGRLINLPYGYVPCVAATISAASWPMVCSAFEADDLAFSDRREVPHDGRTDDHAVGQAPQRVNLVGAADSEADGQRQAAFAS